MFCSKCGAEIVDGARFCLSCGQAIGGGSHENTGTGFVLTIIRAKQWFAVNPAVKAVVDGHAEYRIKNGESLDIPISAGLHRIEFSCSIRNKIVDIDVTGNSVLNLKWNRMTGSLEVK